MALGKAAARWGALVIAAGILVAGCGSDSKTKSAGPAAEVAPGGGRSTAPPAQASDRPILPPSPAVRPPECNEPSVHPQVWFTVCGETGPAPGEPPAETGTPKQIGEPAVTTGATNPALGPGGGTLEITPVAVVYHPQSISENPKNTVFLTVGFKYRAASGTPSATAPIDGGGWTYTTPDGQALEQGNGNGFNVVPESFNGAIPVPAGSYVYASETWDLTEQQRGGVITYTDGTGITYRWQMPAQDGGPEVEKLRADLG